MRLARPLARSSRARSEPRWPPATHVRSRDFHCLAGPSGLVDRHEDLHVLEPFLARHLRRRLLDDVRRERIQLGREVIDLRELERLAVASSTCQTAIVVGGIEYETAALGELTEATDRAGREQCRSIS